MALSLLLMAFGAAQAGDDIRTERVQFAKGATSAVVEGTITGDQIVDYVLGASKGQSMNVSMATRSTATYFNILAPGETEVAFFNGSMSDNQYEGVLPATGDYRIRVYMLRSAARRNEKADYRLEMIVTGKPQAEAAHSPAADGGAAFSVHRDGDLQMIKVGDGRYELPAGGPRLQARGPDPRPMVIQTAGILHPTPGIPRQ
jgi:hypothetical protein